jgi:hypothetical protein
VRRASCPFCPSPRSARFKTTVLWSHVLRSHDTPEARRWVLDHCDGHGDFLHHLIRAGNMSLAVVVPLPIVVRLGLKRGERVRVVLRGRHAELWPLYPPGAPDG